MGFMQQQITEKREWVEIDGNCGITAVDAEDAPILAAMVKLAEASDEQAQEDAESEALEFYDGSRVYSVELKTGYGARLSAPGYMDCTEWTVFDTEAEAEAYLEETYGDEDAE